jgi:carboxyl-terminal processing protease
VVVGERSYGKGSVQNMIALENATTALKLTTASYWRPSGKNIHRFPDAKETEEWGVTPNPGYAVPLTDQERIQFVLGRRDRDRVLGKPGTPAPEKKDKKDVPYSDKALDKALEYLRGETAKVTG